MSSILLYGKKRIILSLIDINVDIYDDPTGLIVEPKAPVYEMYNEKLIYIKTFANIRKNTKINRIGVITSVDNCNLGFIGLNNNPCLYTSLTTIDHKKDFISAGKTLLVNKDLALNFFNHFEF